MVRLLKKFFVGELGSSADGVKEGKQDVPDVLEDKLPWFDYREFYQTLRRLDPKSAKTMLKSIKKTNLTLYCYLRFRILLCQLDDFMCFAQYEN